MHTVVSPDGAPIAYDQIGHGPVVILVGGAFSFRLYAGWVQLAELLAKTCTVIIYDRRGRGDSGDAMPYAVPREVEDLGALIDAVGGRASVFGMSSGAVLALRAAEAGLRIDKLALYEPPFMLDASGPLPPADFGARLDALIAEGKRGDAVRYFMTKGMGVPAVFVTLMRFSPAWSRLKAVAHTLPYDLAVMGATMTGNPETIRGWADLSTPALVIDGEKSAAVLRHASRSLAEVLPNARYHTLPGQSHNVSMEALAPVIKEFLA